jgi:tetratricopeptide (TPR) repeat protein
MVRENTVHDEGAVYDRLTASLQGLPAEESIKRIKEFLATFPSFALAHNDLGVLHHQSGNPTLALAHYEKAARLQPDNTLLKKNLADFYAVELGWLEEAVDIYLDVLKRNPRDTEALIALGHLGAALSGSRTLEAPRTHQQIEMFVPPTINELVPSPQKTGEELYQEAQKLIGEQRLSEARVLMEQALERKNDDALLQNDLAVICYQMGDITAAQRHYERAVALDPDNSLFARNLADLYFTTLNLVDEAIYIYLDLHRKSPRDIETLINLGHICTAVGHGEEAKSFYRRALEIEPWNNEAREALKKQVEPLLQPGVQKHSVEELVAEARLLVDKGKYSEAHDLLKQALVSEPENAIVYNDLGVVAYRLGDIGSSLTSYEQAVKLEPLNKNFRKNLADLYFTAVGRPDDAIHIYLDLFRQNPRDIEVLTSLGQICRAVGRTEEAKTFYHRALEIEPWNEEVKAGLQCLFA